MKNILKLAVLASGIGMCLIANAATLGARLGTATSNIIVASVDSMSVIAAGDIQFNAGSYGGQVASFGFQNTGQGPVTLGIQGIETNDTHGGFYAILDGDPTTRQPVGAYLNPSWIDEGDFYRTANPIAPGDFSSINLRSLATTDWLPGRYTVQLNAYKTTL